LPELLARCELDGSEVGCLALTTPSQYVIVLAIPPCSWMRAWKAVDESSGGSLVDDELVPLPGWL
jgi:predicted dinucleotide-binding enzyme